MAINDFIANLDTEFPTSDAMSTAAQQIQTSVYKHRDHVLKNPDKRLIDCISLEYKLFRAIERARYGAMITHGFQSMEDFIIAANQVLNRRKSRAGKSLENHLSAIFDGNAIRYTAQAKTEGNKRLDFVFPSEAAYQDENFSTDKLISLAAKTTCKDRWRQVLSEARRFRDRPKYLCTMQQGMSHAQMDEMQAEQVVLVVPKPLIETYPKDYRGRIWTLTKFMQYAREVGNT